MNRRRLLAVAGATTLSALAGCLNDDSGDGPTNDTTPTNGTDGDSEQQPSTPATGSFSATSQGGFLAIDEAVETRAQAREEGYRLPAGDTAQRLALEATVAEDGTWESTTVAFPPIQAFGIEAGIELPDGLSGELTDERMTATGRLRVVVDAFDDEFTFSVDATTGQSGALTGATDFEADPPTATLVDNEFVIEEQASSELLNSQLGLPAEDPGTNWFEITIELRG